MTAIAKVDRKGLSHLKLLEALDPAAVLALKTKVQARNWDLFRSSWAATARPAQYGEDGGDWRVWLIMAGRGFGKTRAGAEWIDHYARRHRGVRIALVGASQDDVRQVMIEGESGILSCARGRAAPLWNPSLGRLVWPGGSLAACYSAADPEGLRGPAHHIAWADEVARWDAGGGARDAASRTRGQRTWDNLMMGLRLGEHPRVLATTTPRPVPVLRTILAMDGVRVTGGPSGDNEKNLSGSFLTTMLAAYGETMLGRQEIGGELIEDVPGALWTRGMLESCRFFPPSPGGLARPQADAAVVTDSEADQISPALCRVVIGVDPPASSAGDACGIVVAGVLSCPEPEGFEFVVLADASVERASPERWARAVAEAAMRWGADRIVAEANQGGEMVRRVLEAERRHLPVELRFASASKSARAEPVALAYARGRVAHRQVFAALEDQLCGMQAGGGYGGPGRSPDRADACVWALAELMRASEVAGPRVRVV